MLFFSFLYSKSGVYVIAEIIVYSGIGSFLFINFIAE